MCLGFLGPGVNGSWDGERHDGGEKAKGESEGEEEEEGELGK